uniref:Uncharacterized protein n=1 Tax=Micrococcus phage Kurnik TaxID=3092208 RepID=A0AAU6R625_9CAUD
MAEETFRKYEAKKPIAEYKYRVGFWWGHEVDTFYTDSEEEVLRLTKAGMGELYSITIHQQEYQGSPDPQE